MVNHLFAGFLTTAAATAKNKVRFIFIQRFNMALKGGKHNVKIAGAADRAVLKLAGRAHVY